MSATQSTALRGGDARASLALVDCEAKRTAPRVRALMQAIRLMASTDVTVDTLQQLADLAGLADELMDGFADLVNGEASLCGCTSTSGGAA